MKHALLFTLISLSTLPLTGQEYLHPQITDPGFQAETEYFLFFNHFWLNAHHFLYNAALNKNGEEVENLALISEMAVESNEDENAYFAAVSFYRDSIIRYDLRRSGYLHGFKRWVIQHPATVPLPFIEGAEQHVTVLNDFKKIYDRYFWRAHQRANKEALAKNLNLVKRNEEAFVRMLTDLCQAEWQTAKIRVDLSYNSKRNIPYTTSRPTTHIVIDAKSTPNTEGEWFEMLLHEASHNLIKSSTGFVGGTIQNVAEVLGVKPPRQLWHAYLFYLTGRTAEQLLADESLENYELYMIRKNVFTEYHALLEKHLLPYIHKEISLSTATQRLLQEYYEDR